MKKLFSLRKALRTISSGIGKRLSRRARKVTSVPAKPDKRVLMFGWELPPFNSGGLGVACYELANAIANKNTAVTFVLPKRQPVSAPFMDVAFAEDEGDWHHGSKLSLKEIETPLSPYATETSYLSDRRRYSHLFGPGQYGSSLVEEVYRYGEAAGAIAKRVKTDVIHAHDWLAYPAGMVAKKVSKRPLVAHIHAMEYDRVSEQGVNQQICAIEREGLRQADRVVAISDYVKSRAMKYYGVPGNKIDVVHNGIDLDKYSAKRSNIKSLKAGGRKMVLFTGRITYQKGVDYLVSAAKKVVEHNSNVNFMIVGSGDMQHQVMEQAAHLGISDHVFFPGFLRGEALERMYKSADVYVMPSVSEPFGLVALEALANRVPVILSNQSGAAEVISHAFKVDFWDVDELANKILAVLNYRSLQRTLSVNGYQNVMNCTWDLAADKCVGIYNSVAT